MISYCLVSENWCISGCSFWWRSLRSEWVNTLKLFSLFPYTTNTIVRHHIILEASCLTKTIFMLSLAYSYTIHAPRLSLKMLPTCHRIYNPIKLGSKTHLSKFGIRTNNNPKTPPKKNPQRMLDYHWIGRVKTYDWNVWHFDTKVWWWDASLELWVKAEVKICITWMIYIDILEIFATSPVETNWLRWFLTLFIIPRWVFWI